MVNWHLHWSKTFVSRADFTVDRLGPRTILTLLPSQGRTLAATTGLRGSFRWRGGTGVWWWGIGEKSLRFYLVIMLKGSAWSGSKFEFINPTKSPPFPNYWHSWMLRKRLSPLMPWGAKRKFPSRLFSKVAIICLRSDFFAVWNMSISTMKNSMPMKRQNWASLIIWLFIMAVGHTQHWVICFRLNSSGNFMECRLNKCPVFVDHYMAQRYHRCWFPEGINNFV